MNHELRSKWSPNDNDTPPPPYKNGGDKVSLTEFIDGIKSQSVLAAVWAYLQRTKGVNAHNLIS